MKVGAQFLHLACQVGDAPLCPLSLTLLVAICCVILL